jgi:hypothetical protein
VDLDARADLDADPDVVFAALADLATYPRWLTIVARADPVADRSEPTWDVDLAARIGPFSRTKRLRMVRTHHDATERTVRFERREDDGPTDNPWILTSTTTPDAEVHVHLHYGGALFPGADLVLRRDVDRAGERLQLHLDDAGS